MNQMPCVDAPDDAPVRRDLDSTDVRAVHPDLPLGAFDDASARRQYLEALDRMAYEKIRRQFPEFRPPALR